MALTGTYPLLGTIEPLPQWGSYHHLLRGINNLISPMGRKPISDMSYLVMRSSIVLFLCDEKSEMQVPEYLRQCRCVAVVLV